MSSATTAEFHDVLIIGAGPAGLAVAARLREPTPSAIFTDAEHDRYHWIKKYHGHMNIHRREPHTQKPSCINTDRCCAMRNDPPEPGNRKTGIKVLDSSGSTWLNSWRNNFAALEISHLRSPMFFHPCPSDRDGLLAFAHETGRSGDCVEIANCVGKSMSKHRRKKKIAKGYSVGSADKAVLEIDERDRKDYFSPSAELFDEYCDTVVHRYSLDNLVEQMQVASIDFDFPDVFGFHDDGEPGEKLFKVVTTCGAVKFAKVVVLAVGAGGSPAMPQQLSAAETEGAIHSTQIPKQAFLPHSVRRKILARVPTVVVVVGGGLTAAQIANKCIKDGVGQVFMVIRSVLKLKPFDIDLAWMAKYRNGQKAAFWSADSDEERLDMLLEARNGGSITPHFFKKLRGHITRGTLSIHTQTSITSQSWDAQHKTWNIETDPPILDFRCQVDYIYYATGIKPDVEHLPFLSPLREKVPIDVKGGMPCLTNDLAWAENVPLFLAGRLAGLRIGPDCGNLEGARVGAERISWAVEKILDRRRDIGSDGEDTRYRMFQRIGTVNMYEALDVDDQRCG